MEYKINRSKELFRKANQYIPGGVNSPVRAFKSVGGTPLFIKKAEGSYLYDEDGHRYIDYIASWGPMILGHAHPDVIEAIQRQATQSTSFGAPTELEIEMAKLICEMAPNVDLVRMVNSGTEACMSAIRLARGYTGRNKILKFEGCYHGHADSFLVKAGSGLATFDIQSVPGVTEGVAIDTITCPYNDLDSATKVIKENGEEIAAMIIEPVAGNMGCIPPQEGFLEGLRALCDEHGIILIFDEVMTGFRLAPGGAQELLKIDADLVTYGKVIGGGLPVGAYGGKRDIMESVAPVGKVYQAGTLSGNPLAMIAGLTTLKILRDNPYIYQQLDGHASYLKEKLNSIFANSDVAIQVNQLGSMISVHFSENAVVDFTTSAGSDMMMFKKLFHTMLLKGVYLPPSGFESWFLNGALSQEDMDHTLVAVEEFVKDHC